MRRLLALAVVLALVEHTMSSRKLGDPLRSRWVLGWGGRVGPFRWSLSPSGLNRLQLRASVLEDGDDGYGYFGFDFGNPGCDPVASLVWEPDRALKADEEKT